MTKQQTIDQSLNGESYWRPLYEAWQKSNLSQAAFCKDKDLNYANFIYWRKKFSQQKSKALVPINIKIPSPTLATEQKLDAYLPNNIRLSIPSGFDRATLQVVLQTLEMKTC